MSILLTVILHEINDFDDYSPSFQLEMMFKTDPFGHFSPVYVHFMLLGDDLCRSGLFVFSNG